MITVIKIRKKLKDRLELAVKYYSIISILNNFNWTEFEIHILAFMAVKGNINAGGVKKNFVEWYTKSSESYLNSVLTGLKRNGFIIKEGRKVILNPSLIVTLEDTMILQLNMSSEY